jgi:hypothetical protein
MHPSIDNGLERGFGRTRGRDVDRGALGTDQATRLGPPLTTTLMLAPGRLEEFLGLMKKERFCEGNDAAVRSRCLMARQCCDAIAM